MKIIKEMCFNDRITHFRSSERLLTEELKSLGKVEFEVDKEHTELIMNLSLNRNIYFVRRINRGITSRGVLIDDDTGNWYVFI